jgi:hypothetical protein
MGAAAVCGIHVRASAGISGCCGMRGPEGASSGPDGASAVPSWDEDAGDRLMRMLGQMGMHRQLGAAARSAGSQLEWLKPAVFDFGASGLLLPTSVANLPKGAVVIVLADERRTVVQQMTPGRSSAGALRRAVEDAKRLCRPRFDWRSESVALFNAVLESCGPKATGRRENLDRAARFGVGGLLALLPAGHLDQLGGDIDRCRRAGVCPAIVGLIGPASSGTPGLFSISWPMFLPLAPYADMVLRRIGAAARHA